MKYILPLILLTGCVSLPRPEIHTPPKSVVDVALNATMALVNVMGDTYCAGVISDHLLLTAAHCVDSPAPYWAGFRGGNNEPTNIGEFDRLYFDPVQDLAILRPSSKQLPAGRLLAPEAPVDGSKVVAVGHPIGLTWTITEGIVSRSSRIGGLHEDQHWTQISAPIYFGNSGGPIFNNYGEVVGIASFIARQPHLAGVVHWEEITKAVDQVKSN